MLTLIMAEINSLLDIALKALGLAGAAVAFFVLKRRQNANAEIRVLELEAKELEIKSRLAANVEIEIEACSQGDMSGTGYLILADVTLRNIGSRDTRIKWLDMPLPFSVQRTTFNDEGAPKFEVPIRLPVREAIDAETEPVSTILRAKGSQRLTFAVWVRVPGLYLLAFRGLLAELENKISEDAGAEPLNPKSWTGTKFLVVTAASASGSKSKNDG